MELKTRLILGKVWYDHSIEYSENMYIRRLTDVIIDDEDSYMALPIGDILGEGKDYNLDYDCFMRHNKSIEKNLRFRNEFKAISDNLNF